MGNVSVQVEGLRELTRGLEQAGVEVDDLKDVFADIAAAASSTAQQFTPRGTGALKDTVRPNRAKNKAVVTFGTARISYAGPILFGWPARHIAPARTIPRTDQDMTTKAPQMLEEGIGRVIERLGLT